MPHATLASQIRLGSAVPQTSAPPQPAVDLTGDIELHSSTPLLDALSFRTNVMGDLPYADSVRLIGVINAALTADDAYDAATTASGLVGMLAPALGETFIGAGLNALLISTGRDPIHEKDQALLASLKDFKKADGTRVSAALGVAVATTQVTLAYRAVVNSAYAIGKYLLKQMGQVSMLTREAEGLGTAWTAFAETPVGRGLGFLNKWLPLINATWILMAVKTAFDVGRAPQSSRTSKLLACLNIGVAIGVLMAGISATVPAFFATVLGGLVVEVGLASARQIDTRSGDTDQRVALALKHPAQGVKTSWAWLKDVAGALTRQNINAAKEVNKRLGTPPTSRHALPPAMAPDRLLVARPRPTLAQSTT
jgi:hypothetical protein